MPTANASHILVPTQEKATELKDEIESQGVDFAELAKEHSECPSGKSGGGLGDFNKGAMVPEFDQIVFSDIPIGQVSDPVQTQFGWHLLVVHARGE